MEAKFQMFDLSSWSSAGWKPKHQEVVLQGVNVCSCVDVKQNAAD